MNRKHNFSALILVILLTVSAAFSGCSLAEGFARAFAEAMGAPRQAAPTPTPLPTAPSPAPEPSAAPSVSGDEEEQERRTVPFADMEYERPDVDGAVQRLEQIAAEVKDVGDFAALEEIVTEADDLMYRHLTMDMLAYIHSSLDKTDQYWLDEAAYTSQRYGDLSMAYRQLYDALYETPFREQIEREWDEHYFDDIDSIEYVTEETKPLYEKESDLVSAYMDQLVTSTVNYRGRDLTYEDIWGLPGYERVEEALGLWYEAHTQELGGIYVELVKNRQEVARELGFDSYTDMMLDGENPDYTPDMAESLLDDIVRYAVPAYRDLLDVGAHYNPDVSMEYDAFLSFARDVLYHLSPDFIESFDFMEQYGLIDHEPGAYKEPGGYTGYLHDYDAPFIMMSYLGDYESMSTLVHEFGHFNEGYVTWEAFDSSTDTLEIYSQALDLLFSNYYDTEFGNENGYRMRYDTLSGVFCAIVEQSYYTAVELRVYALDPDTLTVDDVSRVAQEERERFGLADVSFDVVNRYDWVTLPHIYQAPFYTFAYVTSADVALQIWELSLADEQRAVDAYRALLWREESEAFVENVEAAGLASPFASGRMREIADLAERYLVYEEAWPELVA